MQNLSFDWIGTFKGESITWIITGLINTVLVTVVGSCFATIFTAILFFLKKISNNFLKFFISSLTSIIRKTPFLVQLFFWYFSAWNILPKLWIESILNFSNIKIFSYNIYLCTSEFICSVWSLAIFTSVYLIEEIQSGLNKLSKGQKEAALSQGLNTWCIYCKILLPQSICNSYQPIISQYLNLIKLSSLTSAIGFGELTYHIHQIESVNAHSIEAFAIGTILYLILGLSISCILSYLFKKKS
ncbi:MAG: ABC transporter permease subunit [Wigglesworthia glossinidia]|nr:ABC transporter permease subunit [Wigglesworthia glossinidia]